MTVEITRMSAKPPWACPHCGAQANERCSSVRPPYAKFSQMHIQRWNSRPAGFDRKPWKYPS